ncbi:hypothetical protein PF011_g18933 [Phytophthora fragariae]|uniref:Uncharacterized protein n=1 Tax=Phytophthora fragariae TaxID=53985 RepID=A0A6A3J159_9STRA|nr:hypothetical protein PF003_g17199 [Phytophthora fragariae]KAE8989039.1 hypothetical protein PF011_g18933 [Phytophthora fragariae]
MSEDRQPAARDDGRSRSEREQPGVGSLPRQRAAGPHDEKAKRAKMVD